MSSFERGHESSPEPLFTHTHTPESMQGQVTVSGGTVERGPVHDDGRFIGFMPSSGEGNVFIGDVTASEIPNVPITRNAAPIEEPSASEIPEHLKARAEAARKAASEKAASEGEKPTTSTSREEVKTSRKTLDEAKDATKVIIGSSDEEEPKPKATTPPKLSDLPPPPKLSDLPPPPSSKRPESPKAKSRRRVVVEYLKRSTAKAGAAPQSKPAVNSKPPKVPASEKQREEVKKSRSDLDKEIAKRKEALERIEKRVIKNRIAVAMGEGYDKDAIAAAEKQRKQIRDNLRDSEVKLLQKQGYTDKATLDYLVSTADMLDDERLIIETADVARSKFINYNVHMRTAQGIDPRYTVEGGKRLEAAYSKLKNQAGAIVAKRLRDEGATDDQIGQFAVNYSLAEIDDLQSQIANGWMSKGPRSKVLRKFFNKWDEWGSGEQVLDWAGLKKDKSWAGIKKSVNPKAMFSKSNIKRGATLAIPASAAGAVGAVVLGTSAAAGIGVILARSAARTAANVNLSGKSKGAVETRAQQAGFRSREVAGDKIEEKIDRKPGGVADLKGTILTSDIIAGTLETSAEILSTNRKKLIGSLALGMGIGLISATLSNTLLGHFRGGNTVDAHSGGGNTPPTTTGSATQQPSGGAAVPGAGGTTIENHGTGSSITNNTTPSTRPGGSGTTVGTARPGTTIEQTTTTTTPNSSGTSIPQQPNGPSLPKLENMTAEQEKVWNSLSTQDQAKVYAWMHSKDSEKFFDGYKANYDHAVKTNPQFNQGTTTADVQSNLNNPSFTNPQGTGALDKSIAQSSKLAEEMQKAQVKQYAAGLKAVEDHSGLKVGTPEFDAKLPAYVDYAQQIQQLQLNQFLQATRIQELVAQGMSLEDAEKLVLSGN